MAKDDRIYHTEAVASPHLELQLKVKRKEGPTLNKKGQPGEKSPTISRELILRLVNWLEQME
jgi:hypothetical protein